MYLYYGGYWFDQNEAAVTSIRKRSTYSRGRRVTVTHSWDIEGIKQAANQSALISALATLEAAIDDGGSLGLYLDDQSTLMHYLNSSASLGGTRITNFEYPKGYGAEGSTFRTYRFTVEADFQDLAQYLLNFNETITFTGRGGRRRIFLDTLTGNPQEQLLSQRSTYKAVQKGTALGFGVQPTPPGPIWPLAEHEDLAVVEPVSPVLLGGQATDCAISWTYYFESVSPLFGLPNVR